MVAQARVELEALLPPLSIPLMPPMPAVQDTTVLATTSLHRTALHEAGHAVAAWRCTLLNHMVGGSIDYDSGRVEYVIDKETSLTDWAVATVSLAGIAAEMKEFGQARSGQCTSDLLKARECAGKIIMAQAAEAPWLKPGEGHQLPPGQQFERLFSDTLSVLERHVIRRAYQKARELVRCPELHLVAKLFLERRQVPGHEIEKALGGRRPLLRFAKRGLFV
jgi:ATP-dependent Zn protease